MRKLFLLVLTVATITTPGLTDANAYGDKLLRIGRNFRFHQSSVKKLPARMLIYSPPNSATLPGAKAAQMQKFFQEVGHKPLAVHNLDKLNAALKSGQYDLVLTDFAAAATLLRQVEGSPSQTVVLPVLYKRSKDEVAAASFRWQAGVTTLRGRLFIRPGLLRRVSSERQPHQDIKGIEMAAIPGHAGLTFCTGCQSGVPWSRM